MMTRFLLFSIAAAALAVVPLLTSAASGPATFQAAEDAYVALQFDQARALYAAAGALPSQPAKERAAAYRELAVMTWRIDGNTSAAERAFDNALRIGADISTTEVARARFFANERRFDEAIAAANSAAATATTNADREAAALAFARAVLAKLTGTAISAQQPADRALLVRARDLIRPSAEAPPLSLNLAEAVLEVALRLDDGSLALIAWRSYAREGAEHGAWRNAAGSLAQALPALHSAPTPQQREAIFAGLAGSQFFDLASLVATDERVADTAAFRARADVSDVVAYTAALRAMRETTDAYYRDYALRRANTDAWRKALFAAGETLWRGLAFAGARPPYSNEALDRELKRRFAAHINLGETGGVPDLHYGHVFLDDPHTIDQYGHRAVIRVIALDRILSNGYESWVWDGRQAHGGWNESDRVIQIRPGYVDGALRQWERISDPARRREEEDRIARLTQGDDDLARKDPAAYLPGLAARLDWQGRNVIADRLRAQGASAGDLKQRFIIEYNRIGLEANFFAHEGRHVLDKQALGSNVPSEELEFRAKLSEIAFSDGPRFSYGPIFNANIADPKSPHGRANKRIMQGLVAWMDAHRSAVTGLDPARPLLPQFDKLTDEQMRAAMRAMDPWAPKP